MYNCTAVSVRLLASLTHPATLTGIAGWPPSKGEKNSKCVSEKKVRSFEIFDWASRGYYQQIPDADIPDADNLSASRQFAITGTACSRGIVSFLFASQNEVVDYLDDLQVVTSYLQSWLLGSRIGFFPNWTDRLDPEQLEVVDYQIGRPADGQYPELVASQTERTDQTPQVCWICS